MDYFCSYIFAVIATMCNYACYYMSIVVVFCMSIKETLLLLLGHVKEKNMPDYLTRGNPLASECQK